jgi:hypothetical protein
MRQACGNDSTTSEAAAVFFFFFHVYWARPGYVHFLVFYDPLYYQHISYFR